MQDNRQFFYDLIDSCISEFDTKVSHSEKLVLVSDLLEKNYDVSNMNGLEFHFLKRYIHSRIGGDFFQKTKNIAHTLGVKYS